MKTPVAALVLAAAALCAGSTLAQTRPQATAPRAAVPAPPPAVGTVPAGQGQGETRGTISGGVGTFEGETALVVQTRPQAPGPRAGVPVATPAVGTVPAGQGQGQTRGIGGDGSNRDHLDQDAQMDVRGAARLQTNLGATPVNGTGGTGGGRMTTGQTPTNGVGGTGGGRLAAPGVRVINNSETDTAAAAPGSTPSGDPLAEGPETDI
jgi:hypothetical protein